MNSTNSIKHFKYLSFISMLYMTIKLTTLLLIYKVITLGFCSFTASTAIIPFWFFLGTVITETYGYNIARNLIWSSIFCQLIFAFLCWIMIKFQSPIWVSQDAFEQVLGRLPRVTLASSLAIFCGAFLNAYFLAKNKILTKGKYFWIRSIKCSAIGEFTFTIVAYLLEFVGVVDYLNIIKLMTISFLVKLLISAILVVPCIIITKKLKQIEKIDAYDYRTNFNPFSIKIMNEVGSNSSQSNVINFTSIRDKAINLRT